jgi:hypothetical protein
MVGNIESRWPFEEFNPQNTVKASGGLLVLVFGNNDSHYSQAANTLADISRKAGRQVDLLPLDVSEEKDMLVLLREKFFENEVCHDMP